MGSLLKDAAVGGGAAGAARSRAGGAPGELRVEPTEQVKAFLDQEAGTVEHDNTQRIMITKNTPERSSTLFPIASHKAILDS